MIQGFWKYAGWLAFVALALAALVGYVLGGVCQ
jgi:hypothetical protein